MRIDGQVTYYKIQHWSSMSGRPEDATWVGSNLEHMLFDKMPFEENCGPRGKGARYRALLSPQSASSELWQRFGINGFVDVDDAMACLLAVASERPGTPFRIVRQTVTQETCEVATLCIGKEPS